MLVGGGIIGGNPYDAVTLDGTSNSTVKRTAALFGVSDSKLLTCSFWVKPSSGNKYLYLQSSYTTSYIFLDNAASPYDISFTFSDSVGTARLVVSAANCITQNAWNHVLLSVDLTDTAKRFLYVNNTSASPTWSTYSNADLYFSSGTYQVGAQSSPADYEGEFAEFWFGPGQYLALSTESNRRKFITSGGGPVVLGSDGSTPTGTAPAIYLSGGPASFPTNKGTGGTFTGGSALTAASTRPHL